MTLPSVIAIGASAGGVKALQTLAAELPVDIPAAVLIVMHVSPQYPSLLPEILARAGGLPVSHALDGEQMVAGHIYVAPPNMHMLVEKDRVRVVFGPRENRFRPAIDPLFRSVAEQYGPRAVAIILSGTLEDGCDGLAIVKQRGGRTMVQDPADAQFPQLPENALRRVEADVVAPVSGMAALLRKAVASSPREESRVTQEQIAAAFAGVTCPDCGGPIFEQQAGGLIQFRCVVGHSFSPESMRTEHSRKVENALWGAVAILKSHAGILRRMAERVDTGVAAELEVEAREHDERAEEIRTLLEKMNAGAALSQ